ncbi:MAG: hypothetical protein ACREFJ_15850, partial [Acetobacteraceae bacterium]
SRALGLLEDAEPGDGPLVAVRDGGLDGLDPRVLMVIGVVLLEYSIWLMLGWTPDIAPRAVAWVIIVQGVGLGLVFTPLQVLAFATLPVALRTDATSLLSLFRNFGSAIGVSITSAMLDHVGQVEHAVLAGMITPFRRLFENNPAYHDLAPATAAGAAHLNQLINQQAQAIAYLADFKLMMIATLPIIPVILLMRRHGRATEQSAGHAAVFE